MPDVDDVAYLPDLYRIARLEPCTELEFHARLAKEIKEQLGRKFDQDKPRMDLLPPLATLEVAKVLTFGANKYEPNNWKYVPDASNRYTAGALRHIFATMAQEQLDPESGLDHLAHAICCLMFILEDRLEKSTKERPREANAN